MAVLNPGISDKLPPLSPGARSSPLSLMASKSWAGHAEPAAGIVGVLHAAVSLRLSVDLPILHLAQFSNHVAGVAAAASVSQHPFPSGGRVGMERGLLKASRQSAPRPNRAMHLRDGCEELREMGEATAARAEVAGISAFAFQVRPFYTFPYFLFLRAPCQQPYHD